MTALTEMQIEQGWRDTFSTGNPYCPCDRKSFAKAVRWAEHAILSATPTSDKPTQAMTDAEIDERGMKAALDIFGRYDVCHWRFARALLATDPMAIPRTAQPSEAQTADVQRDAERYRWMRRRAVMIQFDDAAFTLTLLNDEGPTGEFLDDQVDALSQSTGEPK